MNSQVEQAIAALALYRRLQAEDRAKLAAVSTLESFPRSSLIFREGDLARSVHLVVEGRVKVAKLTPAGREVILDMPGPGDPIGAVAAFEGFAYPATASATVDSVCLVTRRDAFFSLLEAHPSLVRGLLSGGEGRTVPCDLMAVDEAYPAPVADHDLRTRAHQAWHHGQVLLTVRDGRPTLAVPGRDFTADRVLDALGRLAHAVGAAPTQYAALLRLGGRQGAPRVGGG